MSDQPVPPPPPPPPPSAPVAERKSDFDISDEFGTAKRNLPPAGIVVICVAGIAVILGILAFFQRQKPQGNGAIDSVTAAEVPGQNQTMAAVTVTLRNTGNKPLWIHELKVRLTAADGKTYDDTAASAVDFQRYFEGFPALKENSQPPLIPEMKLMPGAEQKGTVIVSFPIPKSDFDQRKSIEVSIQPYDQPLPIVLKK